MQWTHGIDVLDLKQPPKQIPLVMRARQYMYVLD